MTPGNDAQIKALDIVGPVAAMTESNQGVLG